MPIRSVAALAGLALAGACASPYEHYRYAPAPYESKTIETPDGTDVARVLLAFRGIHEVDDRHEVRFRMRVENLRDEPLTVLLDELQLLDTALQHFGEPRVTPSDDSPLAEHETRVYEIAFPFPPGRDETDVELGSLDLRWGVKHPGARVVFGTTFDRLVTVRHGPPVHVGFGLGYHYFDL